MNENRKSTMSLDEMLDTLPMSQKSETQDLISKYGIEGALQSMLLNNDTALPLTVVVDSPLSINLSSKNDSLHLGERTLQVKYGRYDDFNVLSGIDLNAPPVNISLGTDGLLQPSLLERFQEEFKIFMCDESRYIEQKKLLDDIKKSSLPIIAASIAAALGVTSVLLIPIVILALSLAFEMTESQYCEGYVPTLVETT